MPAADATSPDRAGSPSPMQILAGLLCAGIVFLVQAGGLVSIPLTKSGLVWPVYVVLALAAVALVLGTRLWRSRTVVVFLVFWVLLWVWMPYALHVAPQTKTAVRESRDLGYCALLSVAALLSGRRGGLTWWRIGWIAGLLLVGTVGVWELLTDHHLWATPQHPWPFHGRVAAATYTNPNNFGIVLLSMLTAALAWRSSTRNRTGRAFMLALTAFAAVMVLASQSRAAALGLVLIAGLHILRALGTRPGLVRETAGRHRRALLGGGALVLLLVAATFVVPPLAARNPVLQMVSAAFQPVTAASDLIRVRLIVISLKYLADSHFLGTGAGSFEPILWNDKTSGIGIQINLHNAFFELLSQYGVFVATGLLGVMILLLGVASRTRFAASLRPRLAVVRTEMLSQLLVFVALGFTASSSLNLPVWWLMLANACACGGSLLDRTAPTARTDAARTSTELRPT